MVADGGYRGRIAPLSLLANSFGEPRKEVHKIKGGGGGERSSLTRFADEEQLLRASLRRGEETVLGPEEGLATMGQTWRKDRQLPTRSEASPSLGFQDQIPRLHGGHRRGEP